MFTFQQVRVRLLCAFLLVFFFIYLGSFSLERNLAASTQNTLETNQPLPLALNSCPNGSFSASTNFPISASGPQSVAGADFNNDGNLDIVTANILSNDISLVLGNKNGNFTRVISFSVESGNGPRSITTGDFNRDGNIDAATANFNSNSVAVFISNGQGSFMTATNFPLAEGAVGPIFITSLDFNKDGILDLATTEFSSANISILFGDGLGAFNNVVKIDITNGVGPRAIAVEDFNQDGNIDLAVTNFNSSNIAILLGNGGGGVASQSLIDLGGSSPFSIITEDFNQDGSADLAIANRNDTVSVLLGSPSGAFTSPNNLALGDSLTPQSIQVADFNQDGSLDLVTANSSSNSISSFLGDGKGNFSQPTNIMLPGARGVIGLLAANLNQDTKLDLLTVNQSSGDISVLLNSCSLQCNGNFTDAINFPISDPAQPQSLLLADFNRDGVQDLITANAGNGNLSLLRGNRGGSFGTSNNFTTSGVQPFSITGGDFNRDGNFDVATVDIATANAYVLLGDGKGALGVPTAIVLTGSQPTAIINADFNRDGFLDLATANTGSSTVSLILGAGNGQFFPPLDISLNGGVGPFALVAADFNRDGFPDLAAANLASNNISILTGSVLGFSSTVNNFGVTNSSPRAISVGDLNNDGNLDLAVANFGSNNISILFGDGRANFNLVKTINLMGASKPTAILVADINLDGNLDLAVANSASNNVSLIFGDGNSNFAFVNNLPLGQGKNPSSIVAKDINQDGTVDLIVANATTTNISLFLNLCSCPITPSPGTLAIGQKDVAYSQTINATGGVAPYNFSLFNGVLPNGISLSSSGQLSGIPQEVGIFPIIIKIADSSGCSITQNYSLLIGSDPATRLVIEAPEKVGFGLPFDITLRAIDQNGNNVIGYLGTVEFSSSDPNDIIPQTFTFNFDDAGKRFFPSGITLKNIGAHKITVVDTNNPSLSGSIDFQVDKINTKTIVNTLENPTAVNSPATFIATISAVERAGSIPSGTVTFIIDGIPQAPTTVVNGEAMFVTSNLSFGSHVIVTRYNGDNVFNSSVSNSFTQRVVRGMPGGGGSGGGDDDGGEGNGGDGSGGQ